MHSFQENLVFSIFSIASDIPVNKKFTIYPTIQ